MFSKIIPFNVNALITLIGAEILCKSGKSEKKKKKTLQLVKGKLQNNLGIGYGNVIFILCIFYWGAILKNNHLNC